MPLLRAAFFVRLAAVRGGPASALLSGSGADPLRIASGASCCRSGVDSCAGRCPRLWRGDAFCVEVGVSRGLGLCPSEDRRSVALCLAAAAAVEQGSARWSARAVLPLSRAAVFGVHSPPMDVPRVARWRGGLVLLPVPVPVSPLRVARWRRRLALLRAKGASPALLRGIGLSVEVMQRRVSSVTSEAASPPRLLGSGSDELF